MFHLSGDTIPNQTWYFFFIVWKSYNPDTLIHKILNRYLNNQATKASFISTTKYFLININFFCKILPLCNVIILYNGFYLCSEKKILMTRSYVQFLQIKRRQNLYILVSFYYQSSHD